MPLARLLTSLHDERQGPLPALLLVLTVVTGLVDALSYLQLHHVFVANMTGNIVFLGFAIADAKDFSVPASLLALAAFLVGALVGGRLGTKVGKHRGRLLALATYIEALLIGAALVLTAAGALATDQWQYALIVLLALAMGLQNAATRRIAVPDLTTTVLTLTITGLAADSSAAGGSNPNVGRRVLAVACMFLGAAAGAVLALSLGAAAVLALALALLVVNGIAGYRLSSSSADWTLGH